MGAARVSVSTRPAFYALAPGVWRDYVTLLHAPYTLWHLAYLTIGASLAPTLEAGRLTVVALGDSHTPPLRVGVRDDIRELRTGEPCRFELLHADGDG